MNRWLIIGATLVDEHTTRCCDILIENERIARIDSHISHAHAKIIEAQDHYVLPGLIDTHVHFREPGYLHKGSIATESTAAIYGGVTSYFDMPNTLPLTISAAQVEQKHRIAACNSLANYGFYIGATNQNLAQLLSVKADLVCGVKVFMGSSTGDMLVDNEEVLSKIFKKVRKVIAVHCEDESIITERKRQLTDRTSSREHSWFRPREACLISTKKAVNLAQKYHTKLHVLHISTAEELALFESKPIEQKYITAEACLHHLSFSEEDYEEKQNFIKVNPSIKTKRDQQALWHALNSNILDTIGSDHAPHTTQEKCQSYAEAPSGAPMVGQSLYVLLEAWRIGHITLHTIVQKFCAHPAQRFSIQHRGFLREGYFADLVLFKKVPPWKLSDKHIHHHCKWSPLHGRTFHHLVTHVLVSGHLTLSQGVINPTVRGKALHFFP